MPESLVQRSDPMPVLGDAVDHARNQLGLQLSEPFAVLGGWNGARIRVAAPALVMLLDALAAVYPDLGPNPFEATPEQLRWTGPQTAVLHGDKATWLVATGHHDVDTFIGLLRDRAVEELGWRTWPDNVDRVHLTYMHTPDAGSLTFTVDPVAGAEPVTVWGTAPVPHGVAITT